MIFPETKMKKTGKLFAIGAFVISAFFIYFSGSQRAYAYRACDSQWEGPKIDMEIRKDNSSGPILLSFHVQDDDLNGSTLYNGNLDVPSGTVLWIKGVAIAPENNSPSTLYYPNPPNRQNYIEGIFNVDRIVTSNAITSPSAITWEMTSVCLGTPGPNWGDEPTADININIGITAAPTGTIYVNSNRSTCWNLTGPTFTPPVCGNNNWSGAGKAPGSYSITADTLSGYSLTISPNPPQTLTGGSSITYTLTYTADGGPPGPFNIIGGSCYNWSSTPTIEINISQSTGSNVFYNLYRRVNGGAWSLYQGGFTYAAFDSYADTNISANNTYEYYVEAYNGVAPNQTTDHASFTVNQSNCGGSPPPPPPPSSSCDQSALLSFVENLPATVYVGQSYPIRVKALNTGNTWLFHGSIIFGLHVGRSTPGPNVGLVSPTDFNLNAMGGFGNPGTEGIANITFTAPNTPGLYTVTWEMAQQNLSNAMEYAQVAGPPWTTQARGENCLSEPVPPPQGAYAYFSNELSTTANVVLPPTPTANIRANGSDGPISIPYNTAATISWTSTNVDSCQVSPLIPGNPTGATNAGTTSGNLTTGRVYTLTCTGLYGSATDTVTVNVGGAPTANIMANGSDTPPAIAYNTAATISWLATNVTSCTVTPALPGNPSGISNPGTTTGNLTDSVTYTLNCVAPGGNVSDFVTVNVNPNGTITVITNIPTDWTLNGPSPHTCTNCPTTGTSHTYLNWPLGNYNLTNVPNKPGYAPPTITPNLGTNQTLTSGGHIIWTINYPSNPPSNVVASSAVCTQITITWTDNSSSENYFEVWEGTSSGATNTRIATNLYSPNGIAGTGGTGTFTYTPSAFTTYYYVVKSVQTSTGAIATSAETSATNQVCIPNLSTSTKGITSVQGVAYNPATTTIVSGNTVRFGITINNNGAANATIQYICDTPSANFITLRNLSVVGTGAAGGTAGNLSSNTARCPASGALRTYDMNISGTKTTSGSWNIAFDSTFQSTPTATLEVCSNTAYVHYTDPEGSKVQAVRFPPRLCNKISTGTPDFNEVAP